MQTYLFYDLETTGINPCFDQIVQFAGIRTDLDFNEIERYEYYVRLDPDVVPSPYASITHQISIDRANQGISSYEAIQKIHALVNTPGTISVGYNTLGFDDEFLRFCFYRNLLPPYTHQYANRCGRMDLYPIAALYSQFSKESLNWPIRDDKLSLKLENLNAENQFCEGQAHNALVDVEATVELAKALSKDKKRWDYVAGYFLKQEDETRIIKLPKAWSDKPQRYGLMIEGTFGAKCQFQAPVLLLGQHRHYKNQTIWLRLDREELSHTSLSEIDKTTWSVQKKLAEPGFILPPAERFMQSLDVDRLNIMQRNLQWLNDHQDILSAITEYYLEYTYPKIAGVDADANLYQRGFLSPQETKLCEQFHLATSEKKVQIAEQFPKKDLRTIALRLLGRHWPEALDESHAQTFYDYETRRFSFDEAMLPLDYRGKPSYGLTQAAEDMSKIRADSSLSEPQKLLVDELEEYLSMLAEV